jgi:hypothetical protein
MDCRNDTTTTQRTKTGCATLPGRVKRSAFRVEWSAADYEDLEVDNDERKEAVGKDSHFRLMLKLLSFERTEEEKGESSTTYTALLRR